MQRLQLNRFTSWHKATLISLSRSVLIHQTIRTSLRKAKAVKPLLEKLVSLAKNNTLSAKRQAAKILNDHKLVSLLFNEIGPRFVNRNGGYVRLINLGRRRGDNAEMVILELTEIKKKEPKKHKNKEEAGPKEDKSLLTQKEGASEEKKIETEFTVKEKPPIIKKPTKKFLGGFKNIFKKERRDSA